MGVKISELTEAMAVQNTDELPIVQNGETKKINVETLMSNIQTQITNLQNQVNDKNIITVGFSSDFTISTTGYNDIALNKIITQVGNKMTLSNGKIVIGNGVSHILVSGNAFMVVKTDGAKNFLIKRNYQEVFASMNSFSGVSANMNVSRGLGSKLISVAEGDTIGFGIYGASTEVVSSNTSRTYVTVEVID